MSETNLASALLAAQKEMPAVEPDQTNPHFKSKFVSLGNLLAKVRPVLNRNDLALVQSPRLNEAGAFVLQTTILHSSGESLAFDAPLTPTKNDPQGQGSAITYMRRYSLASALAIADQEDDDGNAGSDEQRSAPSAPSLKQTEFLDKLIGEKYEAEDAQVVRAIVPSLNGAQVSKAIGNLKDGEVEELLNAAGDWLAKQSDIPGDDQFDTLPEID